jgi:integrase
MLTDTQIRNAKPAEKAYKLADGQGLYLMVRPNGAKYWRLKYRFLGKEKKLSIGVYPDVSLLEAREARSAARKQLAADIDPSLTKKVAKRQAILNSENTFEAVAREWHSNQLERWRQKHGQNVLHFLECDIFPFIGGRPIADIEPPELLEALRKIEKRGSIYMAGRVKQICGQVFRYGVATGRCKRDTSADLRGALKTRKVVSFASLEPKEIPEFLRTLERNDARLFAQTRRAIRLLMLTFVRTGELIFAKREEFDLNNAQWVIPAERMKMGNPHIVPLSRQVVAILKEQMEETEHLANAGWLFPSDRKPLNPMSNNTILFALRRMGYKGRMTGHGFRSLAMTTIKEKLGYRHEVVDRQLAHAPRNKVDRAYDRAQFLDDRKKMMQDWADYLDVAAQENKVIIGKFGSGLG